MWGRLTQLTDLTTPPSPSSNGSGWEDSDPEIDDTPTNSPRPTVSVSAPGKALIAGGFLVLEPSNPGAVLAATCRFTSTVSPANTGAAITVTSVQLEESYSYEVVTSSGIELRTASNNTFVSKTLLLTLGYLRTKLHDPDILLEGLTIRLSASEDFYSGSRKTGLGSSAALVTSLVGALLRYFNVVSLPCRSSDTSHDADCRITHNLAQVCHCHAQNKVGSGFDVSSAVYGSHIYTRFSEKPVHAFLGEIDNQNILSEGTCQKLLELVDGDDWDSTVTPLCLPNGLELAMADVCGGSESPSMARTVLDWKRNHRKAGFLDDYYWRDLKRCNKKIATLLTRTLAAPSFLAGLERDGAAILANRTAEQWKKPMPSSWHEFVGSSWDVAASLINLRMALLESRQNLKAMGIASGAPVEPDSQTKLADATMRLAGVVAAGVPGAGGWDALYVIYVKGRETEGGSDAVRDEIGKLWSGWGGVRLLGVRAVGFGGECGIRVEEGEG